MNARRMVMLICLLFMLSGEEVVAKNISLCMGSPPRVFSWGGSSALLNAKDILIGQTVTIRRIDRYQTENWRLRGLMEGDTVTLTFSPTDVIEELDGEQSREPVTYNGNYWCKFDVLEGKKMCYGIVKPWALPKLWRSPDQNTYAHIEVTDIAQESSFPCNFWVVGRYEKLSVPENLDATENPYGGKKQKR